jgi:predicted methyltransferase
MRASNPNLTPEDLDELRKIAAASDAKRDPPPLAEEIAAKLRAFGLVTRNGLAITDRGREVLLEQNMRDAEDR